MYSKIYQAICLILIFLGFLLAGILTFQMNSDPIQLDTVSYLSTAVKIQESGGILRFIPNCWNGVYTQATQHPLYILIISPFAENSFDFFIHAKFVSFIIGALFVLVTYLLVLRRYGLGPATLVACLLVFNTTFLRLTTVVACESLLGLCFILFWYFAVRGFERPHDWLWAGFFAGLAFMAKSSGILCLPIFGISSVWIYRRNIASLLKSKYFWGFFLCFVIVSSPILLRNARVYDNPLHSDSRSVLWIDQWSEYSAERAKEGRFTFGNYLERHSAQGLLRIFWEGISKRDPLMISDGLKPFPFWKPFNLSTHQGLYLKTAPWQGGWITILLMLFLLGLWRYRKSPECIVTGVSIGIFLLFMGWYSKIFLTIPTRFIYCTLFLILIFAGLGLHHAGSWILRRFNSRSILYVFQGFILIFLLSYSICLVTLNDWAKVHLTTSYRVAPLANVQFQWLKPLFNKKDKVLIGQLMSSYTFYFKKDIHLTLVQWPKLDSMKEMTDFIVKNRIDIGILDIATALYYPDIFRDYYHVTREGMFPKKPLPPIFKKIQIPKEIPPIIDFFEFEYE